MAFNIQKFITEIDSNGVQLDSHFEIEIPLPPVLVDKVNSRDGFTDVSYLDQAKILSMRCSNADIPGVALRSSQNPRYGLGVFDTNPFSAGFTPINLTFVVDKNGNIWNFWNSWLNLTVNYADTSALFGSTAKQYTVNYPDDYITTIKIHKYDQKGNKISTVVINRAYPSSMNSTPLAWDSNSVTKLVTAINFRDWHFEGSSIALSTL